MKKKSSIALLAAVIIGVAAYLFLRQSDDFSLENYQPTPEFQDAFAALGQGQDVEQGEPYDIEETIRILNGMEMAQQQSTSLHDFLEYMARQDYSQVPQDVLEAKKQLFPIIEKMRDLDRQYADLGSPFWMVMRSVGTGLYTLSQNANVGGAGASAVFAVEFGDISSLLNVAENLGLEQARNAAVERFERDKELENKLKQEIEDVHAAYVDYLAEYAPVYHKYMRQWEEICLHKDQIYLSLYGGKLDQAYNACQKVLDLHPANKEALLLKAMTLVRIGSMSRPEACGIRPIVASDLPTDSLQPASQWNDYLLEADQLLDTYLGRYPDRSAPALLIRGMLYRAVGDNAQAMICFNQSAQEYPRQAGRLKDMLDSYNVRAQYLSQSAEGLHLLRLYQSTMEGFGMFSPNFQKAACYLDQGNLSASREEIYHHFFRRGNQGIYDCLLSDMEYCEEHLYESFRQMLLEQQYIDVNVEPSAGFWSNSDDATTLRVSLTNRSDIDLKNVRVFLCIHFTDMYRDDYHVVKNPVTKNIISRRSTVDLGEVPFEYGDKKYRDIITVRAIALTDDQVCWLDKNSYKRDRAQQYYNDRQHSTLVDSSLIAYNAVYLERIGLSAERLMHIIRSQVRAFCDVTEGGWLSSDKTRMAFQFPRLLTMLDPVFTALAEPGSTSALSPCFNVIDGNDLSVQFDFEPQAGHSYPFYICSRYLTLRLQLAYDGSSFSIEDLRIE